MPETVDTSHNILPFYDYISGGASFVGAGYPGAFGYLTPGDTSKVYLAPNMLFDFTLVEWQHMTPAQAQAAWVAEFNELSKNSDQPIVVWPWHDYGITQYPLSGTSPYSTDMYSGFIAAAYNSGAEFVTLADLAARIAAFGKTNFSYSVSGDTITATATPTAGNLGTFALDFDSLGTKHIQSVANWYAYDDDSVFLDADGGSYTVTLGTTTADLTHITSIGMRAKLMSLTGNGTDLSFTINGEGKVMIDLNGTQGLNYNVAGATVISTVGEILTLDLGAIGSHAVTVTYAVAPVNSPPAITSNDGGDAAAISTPENTTAVTTVTAVDPNAGDTKTFSLSGGADAALFSIDPSNGTLSFIAAPNFEAPADADHNGIYDVVVKVADQTGLFDTQTLAVTVANVNEAPAAPSTTPAVSLQAGLTQAPLALAPLVDPEGTALTYRVATLPVDGSIFLSTGAAVAVGATLTQAQFLGLTYSSPQTAGDRGLTFDVSDGVNHTNLTVALHVTAGTDDVLTGTPANNRLDGGAGNDYLDGGAGADMMIGGTGNDTYVVDNVGDVVNETGGNGIDTVTSSITFSLGNTARVLGTVENLTLTGTAANGTGNSLANVIIGNTAANALDGGAGSDTLYGGLGNDTLAGGAANDRLYGGLGNDTLTSDAGSDIFVFDTTPNSTSNRDTITDFKNAGGNNDTFWLDHTIFTGLPVGALNAGSFRAGVTALEADDFIVYNRSTGALYYDSNGSALGGAVQFATLTNRPVLTASDFVVI